MTTSNTGKPLRSTTPKSWWSAWVFALLPLALGIGAGLACRQAAGDSLGLFFGGVIFAAILVPPMALGAERWVGQLMNPFAVVAGIAGVWFFGGLKDEGTTAAQSGGCCAVLIAYAAAAAAFAVMLRALRVGHVGASAIVVVIGLAWMTWPIWLAPTLETHAGPALADWLVPAHPLITINGLLPHLGIWNEQSIAYHLTNLGNEVPYVLPATPWLSVAVHGGLAAGFVVAAILVSLRPKRRRRSPAGNGA